MLRRLRMLLLAVSVMFLAIFFATPALAQEVPGDAPVGDVAEIITVNATLVLLLVNFLLPIINGIVLKVNPRPLVAQIVAAFTSGVATLLVQNQQTDGASVFSTQTLLLWAIAFGTQVASYAGVWKSHEVNAKTGPGLVG